MTTISCKQCHKLTETMRSARKWCSQHCKDAWYYRNHIEASRERCRQSRIRKMTDPVWVANHYAYRDKWFKENPGKATVYKRTHRHRKIGMEPEQVEEMRVRQGNLCAVCKKKNPKRDLSLDHDHKTNIVRELLCDRCNKVLGMAQDNTGLLLKLAEYLTKHHLRTTVYKTPRPR